MNYIYYEYLVKCIYFFNISIANTWIWFGISPLKALYSRTQAGGKKKQHKEPIICAIVQKMC